MMNSSHFSILSMSTLKKLRSELLSVARLPGRCSLSIISRGWRVAAIAPSCRLSFGSSSIQFACAQSDGFVVDGNSSIGIPSRPRAFRASLYLTLVREQAKKIVKAATYERSNVVI